VLDRGIVFGGGTCIFLGLVAVTLAPADIVVGGGSVLLLFTMSASVGVTFRYYRGIAPKFTLLGI
jgi:hypothetical protein